MPKDQLSKDRSKYMQYLKRHMTVNNLQKLGSNTKKHEFTNRKSVVDEIGKSYDRMRSLRKFNKKVNKK